MIYELRHYLILPGRAEAILNRFKNHTLKIFNRLGFKVNNFWVEANGNLWYVMEWESEEQMKSAWASFQRDSTWQAVKAESEADGPIVEKENVTILTRPEFVGS